MLILSCGYFGLQRKALNKPEIQFFLLFPFGVSSSKNQTGSFPKMMLAREVEQHGDQESDYQIYNEVNTVE